jgi:GNAT superfamily N-acetyltransferase
VGLAPTGKRRLVTAHTHCGHSRRLLHLLTRSDLGCPGTALNSYLTPPISIKIRGCAFATRAHTLSPATIATHDMTTEAEIRRATAGDAEAVYEIVLRALRETNSRDYPASVIDRLVLTLPKGVASKLEEWHAYVAVIDGRIVGTGSLNGKTIRAVFVHPDYQGHGVGTKLMDAVENAANVQSVSTLSVQ